MVDFTTPSLPGASEVYNKIAQKTDEIEKTVKAGLDATASALTSTLNADLVDLKAKTKDMIPELAATTPVNLQAEVEGLLAMSPNSTLYAEKLAGIGTQFGTALSSGGYDLDQLVTDGSTALSGAIGSLSGALPNFELPAGAEEALEVAKGALQPAIDAAKELAQQFSTDMSADDLTGMYGDAYSTQTLSEALTGTAAKLKTAAENFEAKITALEKQREQRAAESRTEFIDL